MLSCRESKGLRKGAVIVDWPIAISSDTWLAAGIGMLVPMFMPDGLPVYKRLNRRQYNLSPILESFFLYITNLNAFLFPF
jgi:hypothetical protein